jgi:hypothetical protein
MNPRTHRVEMQEAISTEGILVKKLRNCVRGKYKVAVDVGQETRN